MPGQVGAGSETILNAKSTYERVAVIFNFRIGTGRVPENKVRDGSGTWIPSGPGYNGKKENLQVFFHAIIYNLGCPKKNQSPNFGMQLAPVVFLG